MKHQANFFDNDLRVVEIFRTNVQDSTQARQVISMLQQRLGYECNFDLDDCDRILRVCGLGFVKTDVIVALLAEVGVVGEVLCDDLPIPETSPSNYKRAVS